MRNKHLIPPAVFDIIQNIENSPAHLKELYLARLEAIKEIVDKTLEDNKKKSFNGKNSTNNRHAFRNSE